MKIRIYPSITTTTGTSWREKIKEASLLGLEEVCLFLTGLEEKERGELYERLKETKIKKIPLVHLRTDMKPEELDYLAKNYQIGAFNIHPLKEFPLKYEYGKYRQQIYIENSYFRWHENEIKKFAGVCIDFSHLENDRLLNDERYQTDFQIIKKYPAGCGHIASIKKTTHYDEDTEKQRYDRHQIQELSDLDYLKNFPARYFPPIAALELENSISRQMEAKAYLEKILG
ncbi:MAG: hypothetical protein COT34_01050 [Candidatus Nealsonbacteria bacterium CG08_land_8_20_14_0_20_43_11]|uniref:Uncharacterized protein n=1 Tax=Candidatus Nealsonbacteria bacterium CG08_land_8_20_14_0_20_43_11 TaxID=1974706 RepID=A0A2M6T0T7_9BACT|nr:MAG: hypothetical protein COT34_01050 [Candidatus Nealsonbacteria bacterium CG08_land_8_20_14_0_20_43_11]